MSSEWPWFNVMTDAFAPLSVHDGGAGGEESTGASVLASVPLLVPLEPLLPLVPLDEPLLPLVPELPLEEDDAVVPELPEVPELPDVLPDEPDEPLGLPLLSSLDEHALASAPPVPTKRTAN